MLLGSALIYFDSEQEQLMRASHLAHLGLEPLGYKLGASDNDGNEGNEGNMIVAYCDIIVTKVSQAKLTGDQKLSH